LIAKLQSDDPHGVREVVIWDADTEVAKGIDRVALQDDDVVLRVCHDALPPPHRDISVT
jgi:hypothetical protein